MNCCYRGLTEQEYKMLMKECGMYTKKWTYCKLKQFEERRLEIIRNRTKKYGKGKAVKRLLRKLRKKVR